MPWAAHFRGGGKNQNTGIKLIHSSIYLVSIVFQLTQAGTTSLIIVYKGINSPIYFVFFDILLLLTVFKLFRCSTRNHRPIHKNLLKERKHRKIRLKLFLTFVATSKRLIKRANIATVSSPYMQALGGGTFFVA